MLEEGDWMRVGGGGAEGGERGGERGGETCLEEMSATAKFKILETFFFEWGMKNQESPTFFGFCGGSALKVVF
jgi:hypothetical protein